MPQYIADTSGDAGGTKWEALDAFTQGYIEAMLFTEHGSWNREDWPKLETQKRIREGQDNELPHDARFSDLHVDTLLSIIAECADFQKTAAIPLEEATGTRGYTLEQAGRDFWFTRNGHGVGFWDRDELQKGGLGERLSSVCRAYGEVYASWTSEGIMID